MSARAGVARAYCLKSPAFDVVLYDEARRELTIHFGDSSYVYEDVPLHVVEQLAASDSPARWFQANVRPRYSARRGARD
jgi:hypothetical protein